MGAREKGIRITALVKDQPGMLAKITQAIAASGGNFIAFGQFVGEDANTRVLTFKVKGISQVDVKKILEPYVGKIFDIREI